MTRVEALMESIQMELERVCGIKFYKKRASPTAKPPFGVCSLLLMRIEENWELYDLLVNISDYGVDDCKVLSLTESAKKHLHCLDYFGDDGTNWSAYVEKCDIVESADKNIHQFRIIATIKYYRKD